MPCVSMCFPWCSDRSSPKAFEVSPAPGSPPQTHIWTALWKCLFAPPTLADLSVGRSGPPRIWFGSPWSTQMRLVDPLELPGGPPRTGESTVVFACVTLAQIQHDKRPGHHKIWFVFQAPFQISHGPRISPASGQVGGRGGSPSILGFPNAEDFWNCWRTARTADKVEHPLTHPNEN